MTKQTIKSNLSITLAGILFFDTFNTILIIRLLKYVAFFVSDCISLTLFDSKSDPAYVVNKHLQTIRSVLAVCSSEKSLFNKIGNKILWTHVPVLPTIT